MAKIALVLFNLGAPDRLEAVRPFLFNLFNDPAIIGLPQPLRWLVARLASARRAPIARGTYAEMGGGSPLVPLTEKQARALEERLGTEHEVRAFIAMRYWHPMSDETALMVRDFNPDRIVLLPLYPQYSTTTTASSLKEWRRAARAAGLDAPSVGICCYPEEPGLAAAHARLIGEALTRVPEGQKARVLFSAHGLPKRVVAKGDPYAWQVERTAEAVVAKLNHPELDWGLCYQSRVGPLEWIGPSTDDEIKRAGADGRAVVLVPIAFVSEHSETLVELDIEYGELARDAGVPSYIRVPALGTAPEFMDGLADLVRGALGHAPCLCSAKGERLCPERFQRCAQRWMGWPEAR